MPEENGNKSLRAETDFIAELVALDPLTPLFQSVGERLEKRRAVDSLLGTNPNGMSCTESLDEAVSGVVDKLKDSVFADHGTLQGVVLNCLGRLDNARVREAERREACTTTPT